MCSNEQTIRDVLINHVQARIAELVSDEQEVPIPPLVITIYLAGSFQALLTWWLDNDMPYTPEQMNEMFKQLAIPGVMAVLESAFTRPITEQGASP